MRISTEISEKLEKKETFVSRPFLGIFMNILFDPFGTNLWQLISTQIKEFK